MNRLSAEVTSRNTDNGTEIQMEFIAEPFRTTETPAKTNAGIVFNKFSRSPEKIFLAVDVQLKAKHTLMY